MENGVILYFEDTDHGIRIIGQIIGKPEQSKELADDIMYELMGDSDPFIQTALQ